MSYDTHQKHRLESIFHDNSAKSFTVDEIKILAPDVPQSTIYRLLGKLVEEGLVRKCPSSSRSMEYQYADRIHCPRHMHIKCLRCGRIEHISDKDSEKIERLLKNDLDFDVLNTSMLEGICKECASK